MNIGPLEIAIVVVIILVLFGAKRLPDLGKGLGRGAREFKEGITGESKDDPPEVTPPPAAPPETRTPETTPADSDPDRPANPDL
jgi:sec-independent protein translocase protein TatA